MIDLKLAAATDPLWCKLIWQADSDMIWQRIIT